VTLGCGEKLTAEKGRKEDTEAGYVFVRIFFVFNPLFFFLGSFFVLGGGDTENQVGTKVIELIAPEA